MSWLEIFEFSDVVNAALAETDSGAAKLREEAYAEKFDYCAQAGKGSSANGLSICSTPEGDTIYESPELGRVVINPDHTSAHIKPDGGYIYRNASGEITYLQYPNGKLRTFEYDQDGKLTRWTEPDGSSLQRVTDASGQERWELIYANGIKRMSGYTSVELSESGDLTTKTRTSTVVQRADGGTLGISGDQGLEKDANGRVIKEIYSAGFREFHYDKDGCIDSVRTSGSYISQKEGDEWVAYNTLGSRVGLSIVFPEDYDKYASMRSGCRVGENGEGIDVLDTANGKVVSIQDKEGKETLLNFDKSGQLVRVEKTQSKLFKRDNLIWREYRGDGYGDPLKTMSMRDMNFEGLETVDLVECLSQAQLKGL